MSIETIDDVLVGTSYEEEVFFDESTMARFISLSGDRAGIHTRESFSKLKGMDGLVVHGFLLSVNFSRILGMELPGENTVIGSVELKFHEPVYLGDRVIYTAVVDRVLKPLGGVLLSLGVRKVGGSTCVLGKTTCFFKTDREEE